MKYFYALFIAFFFMTFQTSSAQQVSKNISNQEFKEAMTKPMTIILDLRTVKEYEAGHIGHAKLFLYNDDNLTKKLKQLPQSQTYLIYSSTGVRSKNILAKMKALGFPKVLALDKGYKNWK